MLNNVMQPQEIEVFYIIPAIRSHLARYMKESGKSQKDIAELFGLRESTISQYITKKRATLNIDKSIQEKIKKLAAKIKKPLDTITAIQEILEEIKRKQCICNIHRQVASKIPHNCKACLFARRRLI